MILNKTKSVAGADRLDAVSSGTRGCVSTDPSRRRELTRSCHRGKLCERRSLRKKKEEDFRIGSMNVGTMRGRHAEVVETADRRRLDIVFLQETKWAGSECPTKNRAQVRWLKGKDSAYKAYWSGNNNRTNGVGILLAKKWTDSVFEVQRPSDRIILLKLIIGKEIYTFLSVYAPQTGRPDAEKDIFYDQLNSIIAKVPSNEVLIPGGDWNGHVGVSADGFEEVHGGFGFGERNEEGDRLLEFAVAHDLVIGNTIFKKRDSHLITFQSGDHNTQIDYVLFRRSLRKCIQDVKVIPGEECMTQHRLLVCIFKMKALPQTKRKFKPRLKLWKLKDPACAANFEAAFKSECGMDAIDSQNHSSEEIWVRLKRNLQGAAESVCGFSKGHRWKKQTWWWDGKVEQAISEKRKHFKAWKKLLKQKKFAEASAEKTAYQEAKRHAKSVVWSAKTAASKAEFANIDPNGPDVYRIAKQMCRDNQEVSGEMPVRNNQGHLCLDDDGRKKAWVEHYQGLLNVEFPWDKESLAEAPPILGPPPPITNDMVSKALSRIKSGKAAGPSGIVIEMLKAAGLSGIEFLRELTISIVRNGRIPQDWELSYILNLYKGKGDALTRGNYRGLKLTEHVMKVIESLAGSVIRDKVDIDEMQYAYVTERGTLDPIFIIRQLQETYLPMTDLYGRNATLYFAFVDLEKAFDRVPRDVLWWSMRSVGIDEWVVSLVQSMYKNARSKVRVGDSYSEEFEVSVGVHQGSVLSPLLFIIVLEALSRDIRVGVPWEMFFADDLVIIADSLDKCVDRVKVWKEAMEAKGLRVNMNKTVLMASGHHLDVLQDSGKYPCAVCRSGVGSASIMCSKCLHWVHKKCSGLNTLTPDPTYQCPRCRGDPGVRPIDGRPFKNVQVGDSELNFVESFCYLGDMLSAGGGCETAAVARCKSAWAKFHQLSPLLTSRCLAPKIKGRLYSSCVRSVMLYASETWPMSSAALSRLRRNDRVMIRWIIGVKPSDDTPMSELLRRLDLSDLTVVIRERRLRWFGHVMRSSGEINRVTDRTTFLRDPVRRRKGRPKKTWYDCVKQDLKTLGLSSETALDRVAWRSAVRNSRLEQTSHGGSVPQNMGFPSQGRHTRSRINKTRID